MLARSRMKRTRSTQPSDEVVLLVLARAVRDGQVCCEPCGGPIYGERGVQYALHHRKGRGLPDSHTPQNLIVVHGSGNVEACHGRIHANRGEAQTNGWSISRNSTLSP